MSRTPAATGVSDHYGLAVLVTVALDGGTPLVIDRREIALRDPHLPGSPYHHDTLAMPAAEADALLRACRAAADRLAETGLKALMDGLGGTYEPLGLSMRPPPLPHLPQTAAEAHADYRVQCAADGMLYHHAVAQAAGRLGLPVRFHQRRTEIADAAAAGGTTLQAMQDWLKQEGKRLGPPWRADEKTAAASALAMLHAAIAH